jgi:nucleoside-diphosphate-sugar epimerase
MKKIVKHSYSILLIGIAVSLCSPTSAFLPSFSLTQSSRCNTLARDAAIVPGDTILVVGGTGGVGQLVTQKLRNSGYKVRVTSRNPEQAREILGDEGSPIDVVPLDLIQGSPEQLTAAVQGVAAAVISVGTTAFPTLKWRGGNTPQAIDADAVKKLVDAATANSSLKKIVLVTSVGVYRTGEMPFKILNLFGVLDAKRTGEDALKKAASGSGFDFVIVRPGRLIGGPFTNYDVARLLQIEGGAENGVDIQRGDALLGDCKRDACAQSIVQALQQEAAKNVEFSIVSNDQSALSEKAWEDAFLSLSG